MQDFWTNKGNDFILALIMLILGVILAKPLEAFLKWLWKKLEAGFQSLGFGFQKRYFRALNENHQWLKLIGIYNPADLHAPRLREVFISLRMNTAKDAPAVTWDHIFNGAEKHMVIVGQPGAGKSTLLDYLTLVLTGYISHPLRARLGKPVPVFVRLRDLGTTEASQNLLNLIESPANIGLKRVPSGYFERLLHAGKCVVLLDGLDEVLDEQRHKQVVKEICAFASEYPENWMVVTCRVAGWHGQLPNFRLYDVQEFDRDDVRQFIGAWYREVTRTAEINKLGLTPKAEAIREAETKAYQESLKQSELLWNALLKNEPLLRIARTPLILSLITLVHKNRTTDLPRGRARLYRECLDILLDLWDAKDKGLIIPDAPSPNDKLLVLKTIGYHYVENGLLEMDSKGLEQLVTPLLPTLTRTVSAASLIRHIVERSGVLVETAIGKYGFAHRALHDYLAASCIAEQNLDAVLLKHADEERWREVILIAIGLVSPRKRAEALLQSLLLQSSENAASLALAGWSLAEDIQVGKDLHAAVKEKIMARLSQTESAGDFALLSGALLDTDTPAFNAWMQSVLTSNDVLLRVRVMNTLLPELGHEKGTPFAPLLIKILADTQAEPGQRMHAAMILPKIIQTPDAELWRALEDARQVKDTWLKQTATWACCEFGRYEEIGLLKVPAGEFIMGSEDITAEEKPQHIVYLPTFYIAKYPVTAAQYRAFAQESGYNTSDKDSLKGPDTHPVVNVNWHDALAYARWQGLNLPTEAEWEKAARGADGRVYPWGDEWRENHANTAEYWEKQKQPAGFWERLRRRAPAERGTTPIGFFSPAGDSPYGCADMSGNVWEWTHSLYQDYPYRAEDGREDARKSGDRVLRGGSFNLNRDLARCALRLRLNPDYSHWDGGFRVVSAPIFESEL